MKILQIIYSLSSGGGERFVVDLCNRLAKNEEDKVVLLTICDSNNPKYIHYLPELSQNVRFENLHKEKGLSWESIWGIYKFIKKEKPDIVHCHSNLVLLYLPCIFNRNIKFVHTLHNLAQYCLSNKYLKQLNKWMYSHYVQAITISSACDESFNNLYSLRNSICIINGRETISSSTIPLDVNTNEKPIIVHIARCSPQKNQSRLFFAFERLYDEKTPFQLICIGDGFEKYKEKYKENTNIHILGIKNNIPDYLSIADFFILSSDFEGLPISLLEAMSMGVVPISTPAGGVVDVIRDGENGYMTKGFGDEEFYLKVKQAISEQGKISSDLLKKEYEEKYSMKVCTDKYYNVYNQ